MQKAFSHSRALVPKHSLLDILDPNLIPPTKFREPLDVLVGHRGQAGDTGHEADTRSACPALPHSGPVLMSLPAAWWEDAPP